MKPWYDDIPEIIKRYNNSVNRLQVLNKLFECRHDAHYKRNERLSEFYVLYQWKLDTCGNALKITDYDRMTLGKPDWGLPNSDNVIQTEEQYYQVMSDHGINGYSGSYQHNLPPHDVKCSVCGKFWNIDNCTDVHVDRINSDKNVVDLKEFIGKSLRYVRKQYEKIKTAKYKSFNSDEMIVILI